jgi:hypothetical protein
MGKLEEIFNELDIEHNWDNYSIGWCYDEGPKQCDWDLFQYLKKFENKVSDETLRKLIIMNAETPVLWDGLLRDEKYSELICEAEKLGRADEVIEMIYDMDKLTGHYPRKRSEFIVGKMHKAVENVSDFDEMMKTIKHKIGCIAYEIQLDEEEYNREHPWALRYVRL